MTLLVKELLQRGTDPERVALRSARRKAGLRATWVDGMLSLPKGTTYKLERGNHTYAPELREALRTLYARWADACAKQRELEAVCREMIANGTTRSHRRLGGRKKAAGVAA